jgi:transposase
LCQRIEAGCINKSQLWREIVGQGFVVGRSLVGKWIRQNYRANVKTAEPLLCKAKKVTAPCPRELAWLLIGHSDKLDEEEKQHLNDLLKDNSLAELRQRAHKFIQIVHDGLTDKWATWIKRCCQSAIQELKNFAIGLERDSATVYEMVAQSWSNGLSEGHVNRLKYLKRQI